MENQRKFKPFFSNFEAIGLILILISFGWQQFESDSNALRNREDLYQIHKKLDAVGAVLIEDYWKNYPDELESPPGYNVKVYFNNWKHWNDLEKNKETLKNQIAVGKNARIVLYLIGSLFFIYSRLKIEK
ncbi:hypothetical protein [Labilibaculum euxinus]